MKKYLISKFYLGFYILMILFFAGCMLFVNYIDGNNVIPKIMYIMWWYGIIYVFFLSFKFPIGSYTLNKEGITLYVGLKKYRHNWSDFQYITFYGMDAEQYGAHTFAYTYWICLSEKNVRYSISYNPFSKNNLLKFSRRNLDTIACFQYRKEIVPLLNEYLPEELKPAFSWQADLIKDNMNWIEKIYNK